ncbi:MAG: hypothetical protein KKD92_14045 [Proteobacteria bacterium]|nr:hypothetical protein [Pseudomonadota bacterium]
MRKKEPLSADQIRLKELDKVIKKNQNRLYSFLIALGELSHKELHTSSHKNLDEYLFYKHKFPMKITTDLEKVAVTFYNWFYNIK